MMQSVPLHSVRFTQDSIRETFKDGKTLDQTIEALRNGTLRLEDLPAIQVVKRDDIYWSLNNRRLHCMRSAFPNRDKTIRVRLESLDDPSIRADFSRRLTTKTSGKSIVVFHPIRRTRRTWIAPECLPCGVDVVPGKTKVQTSFGSVTIIDRQGQTHVVSDLRKDVLVWEHGFEKWDWNFVHLKVDESTQKPLSHSPGVIFDTIKYALDKCERTCQELIVSAGFAGQLPIKPDAAARFREMYPQVILTSMNTSQAAQRFNTLMGQNRSAVLLLHATC